MDCYVNKVHIPPGRSCDLVLIYIDHVSPDMMASLEDVMVLIVIVAMEYVLYPHLSKTVQYNFPPLHKVNCYYAELL